MSAPGTPFRRIALVTLGVIVVAGAALGYVWLRSSPHVRRARAVLPLKVVSAPKNLVAATGPNQFGQSWIVTSSRRAANIQLINVKTGQTSVVVPTPIGADSITESPGGPVAVGFATATTGAVVFYAPSGGARTGAVALPGPVMALSAAANGTAYYALVKVGTALSVSVIDATTMRIANAIPMPKTTVAIAIDPSQTQLFALTTDGTTSIVSVRTKKVTQRFVTGPQGRAMSLSPDGSRLYVLDGSPTTANVAVVNLATQSIVTRIPAPAHCVAVAPTLTDSLLIDFVGTATYGNIQSFRA